MVLQGAWRLATSGSRLATGGWRLAVGDSGSLFAFIGEGRRPDNELGELVEVTANRFKAGVARNEMTGEHNC